MQSAVQLFSYSSQWKFQNFDFFFKFVFQLSDCSEIKWSQISIWKFYISGYKYTFIFSYFFFFPQQIQYTHQSYLNDDYTVSVKMFPNFAVILLFFRWRTVLYFNITQFRLIICIFTLWLYSVVFVENFTNSSEHCKQY